jgi:hypothetical protein
VCSEASAVMVAVVETDVSEKRVASVFRVEEITRARKSVRRLLTD